MQNHTQKNTTVELLCFLPHGEMKKMIQKGALDSSYQERYIFLEDEIGKQMKKYAICTEDLNEIEQHLNTTDYNV